MWRAQKRLIRKDTNAGKGWRQKEKKVAEVRWLDSITNSVDMNLGELQEMMRDRKAWHASGYGVAKNWTQLNDWTITMWNLPGPGIEPMSLALAARFLATGPPGKFWWIFFLLRALKILCDRKICYLKFIEEKSVHVFLKFSTSVWKWWFFFKIFIFGVTLHLY